MPEEGGATGVGLESEVETVVVQPITRFDRRLIEPALGVTAAIVIALPVAVAVGSDLANAGVMIALGAFNMFLGCGGFPARLGPRTTLLALGLNAVGLAAGTLVAALGLGVLVAVAVGIALLSLARLIPGGRWVAVTSAVLFAVGVGVPGASLPAAGDRLLLALAGGAWAIAASWTALTLISRSRAGPRAKAPGALPDPSISRSTVALAAAVTGVAAAAALGLADAFGLPRDYWTMLTVVVVFQMGLAAAISTSAVRVVGTVVGAAIGGGIAAAVSGPVALTATIGALGGGTLAVRPASPSVYVLLLTPFVIVLLSVTYPSGWALAEDRIIDTLLGSACALAATFALWGAVGRRKRGATTLPRPA